MSSKSTTVAPLRLSESIFSHALSRPKGVARKRPLAASERFETLIELNEIRVPF